MSYNYLQKMKIMKILSPRCVKIMKEAVSARVVIKSMKYVLDCHQLKCKFMIKYKECNLSAHVRRHHKS